MFLFFKNFYQSTNGKINIWTQRKQRMQTNKRKKMRDVGKMIVENFNDLDETQLPTFPRLILQETLSETECTDHCTKPIHTIPALNNKIQVLFQRKIYIESTKTLR